MEKNTNLIKAANQALVIDAIRCYQPVRVDDIIRMTHLSRQTVLTIMKNLMETGIIEKSGLVHQNVGRQPMLYSVSTQQYFAIGIDVDIRPIYLTVSRLDGTAIYNQRWEVPQDIDAKAVVLSIIEKINEALEANALTADKIIGIGLGLPAILDIKKNMATRISRINGWENVDVAEYISKKTGIDTYVRNDAHLLANLEITPSKQEFLFILHRSGIGMAPVINGKVYEGRFGNSGYIGHTQVGSNGYKCDCGSMDCLELYCSKRRIEKDYQSEKGVFCKYDEIIERAENDDIKAVEILKHAGAFFGIGIANAIKMYDISSVVIGDLRCSEEHVFFKSIVESVIEHSQNFSSGKPEIHLSSYQSDFNGMGGCQYVLNNFFTEPKLHTQLNDIRKR